MAELPRLLLCTFDVIPSPTGLSRRVSEYLNALDERFQAVVLSVKTPDHSHIEKYRGARLLRVPLGNGDLASRIQTFDRAVRRQLESEEYAIAHFTDPFGGYALCETRGDYGHKLVYEALSFPSQEIKYTVPASANDRRFQNKVRRQELFCLMNADQVITGSSFTKNFIQSLGVPADHVRVLRPPVDLTPFQSEVLGLPDAQPMRVLYLGSSYSYQGLNTLLEAMKLALSQTKLTLSIIGPRPQELQAALEEKVHELGLKDAVQVQYGVAQDELFKVVAASDVGVVPLEPVDRNSIQGGALAKVAEYFAGGRPVVAADLPITREVVTDEAGAFYEPGDPKALATELVRLAKDPSLRVRLGGRARAIAEERHEAARIRRAYLDMYASLMGGGVRPAARANPQEAAQPTQIGAGAKKDGKSARKKPRAESRTDPAIKARRDEPTDPNRPDLAAAAASGKGVTDSEPTGRAEPMAGPPPSSLTPDSFVGAMPEGPLLTGGKPAKVPAPDGDSAGAPSKVTSAPGAKKPPLIGGGKRSSSAAPKADEPDEISADDVVEAEADAVAEAVPEALPDALDDEPEPISDEEIAEVDDGPTPTNVKRPAPRAPPPLLASPSLAESPPVASGPKPLFGGGKSGVTTGTKPALAAVPPAATPPGARPLPRIGGGTGQPDKVTTGIKPSLAAAPPPPTPVESAQPPTEALPAEDAEAVSRLDPWYAQLVHGYCPPEGASFARHTPPTNFPGRDDPPRK